MKLVPTETKTITTNGVTHEISRYILVPDDQTNGPSADSTNEKIRLQIIPTAVNNDVTKDQSKQVYRTSSNAHVDNLNDKVMYETTVEPEDIRTVKSPGLVKYHVVLGAHPDDNNQTDYKVNAKILKKLNKINNGKVKGNEVHTKVNIKDIPDQDFETNVIYINKHNGAGTEHQHKGQSVSIFE